VHLGGTSVLENLCNLPTQSMHVFYIIFTVNTDYFFFFNISGFHIVVLLNLSKELVYIPSNTTK
jgi:hypothetical protein